MADRPLGAGQHRVVVGKDGAAAGLPEEFGVDPGGAGDDAVAGGSGDQVLGFEAGALGRDGVAAVLDEAALVDQVVEVLAGRSAPSPVPFRHGVRPALVQGQRSPAAELGKVGTFFRALRHSRKLSHRLPGCLTIPVVMAKLRGVDCVED